MAKRERRKNLKMEINDVLQSRCRFGESRHAAKAAGTSGQGIYSYTTYHVYQQQCHRFAAWIREHHPEAKNLHDAFQHINRYLQSMIDEELSPYTIKTAASALGKLYQCKTTEWIKTPKRNKENITKNRNRNLNNKHWNPTNHPDEVEFMSACGLRRNELKSLRGSWCIQLEDGRWYIDLTHTSSTKGGKPRMVPIVSDNIDLIVKMCKDAGEGKVFPTGISKHCNVHRYRAMYCKRVYDTYARDLKTLSRKEIYYCRGNSKKYDKAALRKCSNALGHERTSVVAANYSYMM